MASDRLSGKTEALLTWTLRVAIQHLSAHLEAYVSLLPVLNMIRLCNRHGQGPNAAITKLPIELVVKIEEFYFAEVFPVAMKYFMMKRKAHYWCFLNNCQPADHLADGELDIIARRMRQGDIAGFPGAALFAGGIDGEHPARFIHQYLWTEKHLWQHRHHENISNWNAHLGLREGSLCGFFIKQKELIRKHFGLEVWISHAAINPEERYSHEDNFIRPLEDTMAYLILPGQEKMSFPWRPKPSTLEIGKFHVEQGASFTVELPTQILESEKRRFTRMANILRMTWAPIGLSAVSPHPRLISEGFKHSASWNEVPGTTDSKVPRSVQGSDTLPIELRLLTRTTTNLGKSSFEGLP